MEFAWEESIHRLTFKLFNELSDRFLGQSIAHDGDREVPILVGHQRPFDACNDPFGCVAKCPATEEREKQTVVAGAPPIQDRPADGHLVRCASNTNRAKPSQRSGEWLE